MYLSEQQKKILLVLATLNPRRLRLIEIIVFVTRVRPWEPHRKSVLFSSFSRSIKSLLEKKLVMYEGRGKRAYWYLTRLGLDKALEIRRNLESRIRQLEEYRQILSVDRVEYLEAPP